MTTPTQTQSEPMGETTALVEPHSGVDHSPGETQGLRSTTQILGSLKPDFWMT
jgi:hypothetical protein